MDLAAAAGRGEPRACRHLAERLLDRTRATAHYVAAGDRDADDLAQLALVEVLRSAHTFRGDCGLERWADRITIRTAIRELKRRRWRESIVSLVPDPGHRMGYRSEPEIHRRLLRRHLARLLGHLSTERRTAVVLHWVHGYSVAEVAEITETGVNTVRDRLQVARKQLRKHLRKDPALQAWAQSVLHDFE